MQPAGGVDVARADALIIVIKNIINTYRKCKFWIHFSPVWMILTGVCLKMRNNFIKIATFSANVESVFY